MLLISAQSSSNTLAKSKGIRFCHSDQPIHSSRQRRLAWCPVPLLPTFSLPAEANQYSSPTQLRRCSMSDLAPMRRCRQPRGTRQFCRTAGCYSGAARWCRISLPFLPRAAARCCSPAAMDPVFDSSDRCRKNRYATALRLSRLRRNRSGLLILALFSGLWSAGVSARQFGGRRTYCGQALSGNARWA